MFGDKSLCPVCGANMVLHAKNGVGERVACEPTPNVTPVSDTRLPQRTPKRDWAAL